MPKQKGEGQKRKELKQILVITDELEQPITNCSRVHGYLTMGLAEGALRREQNQRPDEQLQITVFVPQSTRLVFMDGDE
ncbi:hypothetical protein D3C85_874060 [compost metagenome]